MNPTTSPTVLAAARAGVTPPDARTVPVADVYGPVHQGEGPYAGRVVWFVRLGLCNLHCTWCDTPYTWDRGRYNVADECPPETAADLTAALNVAAPGIVVLSGGEPLIHQRNPALLDTMRAVTDRHCTAWHVETNGTIAPTPEFDALVSHYTVSPKLAPQGDPERRRIRYTPLRSFTRQTIAGRAVFKVVCDNPTDVDRAAEFYQTLNVPSHARWVMPLGDTPQTVLDATARITDRALHHGLNLTLRTHTLTYGTERRR